MTTKRFGHQDIKDYILGKLTPEQVKEIENAIANEPALKKIYTGYNAKKDLLLHYEAMQFTPEESDAGYKRVLNSRKKPVWAPGQVWEIEDLGRMLILSVNNLFQCRGMLLSKSTQFASSGDIIFKDPNIAATELCAYSGHIFTINPEHLTAYSGQHTADVLQIFRKTAAGQKVQLPEGYAWGEESDDPEAEIWHEYISEVLNEFTAEALETYENASDLSRELIQLTQMKADSEKRVASVKPNYQKRSYELSDMSAEASLIADEEVVMYSLPPAKQYKLAASSAFKPEPEKKLLYKKSGEIKIEAALDKEQSGLMLIITFISGEKQIKKLSLKYQGVSFFDESNIQVTRKIARLTILMPEVLARFAILPVELLIETDVKTYSVPLEMRKGGK